MTLPINVCNDQFPEAMGMLWKRMLQDNRSNWRRTYKSLLLLDYLIKNGSERVVTSAREHIYDLRSMENYTFVDENGTKSDLSLLKAYFSQAARRLCRGVGWGCCSAEDCLIDQF